MKVKLFLCFPLYLLYIMADGQTCLQANAGPDKAMCSGAVTIGTPATTGYIYSWSPTTGLSNPNIAQPTATVSSTTVYTLRVIPPTANLLTNGDFENGNTGFSTDYGTFPAGDQACFPCTTCGFGSMTVGTNAGALRTSWCSGTDHTIGGTKMLIVDGSCNANHRVWFQTVTVSAGTNYFFSGWASHNSATSPTVLRVRINTDNVVNNFTITTTQCDDWVQFAGNWNSGTSTSATIEIYDNNTAQGGNDFNLDDLFFSTCPETTDQVTVTTCEDPCIGTYTHNSGILPANLSANTIFIGSTAPSGGSGVVTNSNSYSTDVVAGTAIIMLPDFNAVADEFIYFRARIQSCSSPGSRSNTVPPVRGALTNANWIETDTLDSRNMLPAILELYPNPAGSILNLKLPYASSELVRVFNSTGRLVLEKVVSFSGWIGQLDISHLPRGSYFVYIRRNEFSAVKHFLKI
jgi:hypothetical protein